MATIDALSRSDVLYDTDEIPLFSPIQEDTKKASLAQITAFVQAQIEGTPDDTVYSLAVTQSGVMATVLPPEAGSPVWAQLSLSGPIAALTIILPDIANRAPGQDVLVTSTQAVTTLTVNGNGATVSGAPTALLAGGFFRVRYDSISNTWFRIG